jgi:hypothetical protein
VSASTPSTDSGLKPDIKVISARNRKDDFPQLKRFFTKYIVAIDSPRFGLRTDLREALKAYLRDTTDDPDGKLLAKEVREALDDVYEPWLDDDTLAQWIERDWQAPYCFSVGGVSYIDILEHMAEFLRYGNTGTGTDSDFWDIRKYVRHIYGSNEKTWTAIDNITSTLEALERCSAGANYFAWYGAYYFPKARTLKHALKLLQIEDDKGVATANKANKTRREAIRLSEKMCTSIDQTTFWQEFTDAVLFIELGSSMEVGTEAEIQQERRRRRILLAMLHRDLDLDLELEPFAGSPFVPKRDVYFYKDETCQEAAWGLRLLAVSPTEGTFVMYGGASD